MTDDMFYSLVWRACWTLPTNNNTDNRIYFYHLNQVNLRCLNGDEILLCSILLFRQIWWLHCKLFFCCFLVLGLFTVFCQTPLTKTISKREQCQLPLSVCLVLMMERKRSTIYIPISSLSSPLFPLPCTFVNLNSLLQQAFFSSSTSLLSSTLC